MQAQEVDLYYAEKNNDKDYVLDPNTNKFYHPGVTLAVGELFKEVSSWEGFWAVKKAGSHWEPIILKF